MLSICYQDEHLIAIDKPGGLLVHRSMIDRHATEFAMQMLRDQIGQHVFPVHRLDRPTSGVLLFALSSDVARLMSAHFENHLVSKHYIALVRGFVNDSGILDYPLKEELDKIADKKANQDKEAKEAITQYSPLQQYELPFAVGRYSSARYTLMSLRPKTGRKHQLRRHMAHLRHPIAGDTSHGDGKHNRFLKEQFQLSGLCLSCTELAFPHPITGKEIIINSESGNALVDLILQWKAFEISPL